MAAPPYNNSGGAFEWAAKLDHVATHIKLNEWKVLCVSKNHTDIKSPEDLFDDNPFLSGGCRPRMWAHYAENHKGVCLKFNGDKLDEQIKKILSDKECKIFCGDVEYDDKGVIEKSSPPISLDNIGKLNNTEFAGRVREYFFENYKAVFLQKSKDWESEYEFRWLIHSEKNSAEYISIIDVLEEVILGADFPQAYDPIVFKLQKELGVKISKIRWWNGVPEVVPHKEC